MRPAGEPQQFTAEHTESAEGEEDYGRPSVVILIEGY